MVRVGRNGRGFAAELLHDISIEITFSYGDGDEAALEVAGVTAVTRKPSLLWLKQVKYPAPSLENVDRIPSHHGLARVSAQRSQEKGRQSVEDTSSEPTKRLASRIAHRQLRQNLGEARGKERRDTSAAAI